MRMKLASWHWTRWLLLAILALGLVLRLWGIDWGMPFIYHPDEAYPINGALQMVKTGDLDPHTFHWGSLIFYLNALLYLGYLGVTKLLGAPGTLADLPYLDMETIAVGLAPVPAMFVLSRVFIAIVGTGSIVLVYLIAREVDLLPTPTSPLTPPLKGRGKMLPLPFRSKTPD